MLWLPDWIGQLRHGQDLGQHCCLWEGHLRYDNRSFRPIQRHRMGTCHVRDGNLRHDRWHGDCNHHLGLTGVPISVFQDAIGVIVRVVKTDTEEEMKSHVPCIGETQLRLDDVTYNKTDPIALLAAIQAATAKTVPPAILNGPLNDLGALTKASARERAFADAIKSGKSDVEARVTAQAAVDAVDAVVSVI